MSLEQQTETFEAQVWQDEPAAFLESRGLNHSTIKRFRLGYTGALGKTKAQDLRRCLVLPYEDGLGRVRQLRYRPLFRDPPSKYITAKGEHAHLFAVRAADNPTVYVCEGEIDTMTLWQVGLKAVGIPGAATWKPDWKWIFRPPHVQRVVLVLDPDEAGISAARRMLADLKEVVDVDIVKLPSGLDVNDVLRKMGPETLREALI
jgi:DNA primase